MKSKFIEIKNQTDSSSDLYIYGDIVNNSDWKWDESEVMPDDVKNLLESVKDVKTLNIYINSAGGSVHAGLAIYHMLKRSKAYKVVHVDGVAASISSIIALSGDRVIIPSSAYFMIHSPWTIGMGNAKDFRKMADDLDVIEAGIMNVYKDNLKEGVELSTIQEMVDAETWLTGEEASKYFNIEVGEASKMVACASDYYKDYKQLPNHLNKAEAIHNNKVEDENEKLKWQNELELLSL